MEMNLCPDFWLWACVKKERDDVSRSMCMSDKDCRWEGSDAFEDCGHEILHGCLVIGVCVVVHAVGYD